MTKVPFAKYNDMVKTIPPDRSDEPLCTSVLPWRSWRDGPIPYAHRPKSADKDTAKDAIPVTNDVSRRLLPTRMPRSVVGQSIPHSDARLHPATEAHVGCVAKSGVRTTAETRSSGPGTDPSMRRRRHDCEGRSSIPATAVAASSSCTTVVCPTLMPKQFPV
jgi:hypothetical protein